MTKLQFRAFATPNRAVRQAQVLSPKQVARLVSCAKRGMNAERDVVGVYLSFYCGLRAAEIAGIRWIENILDAEGEVRDYIQITGDIGKNSVARTLHIPPEMVKALKALRKAEPTMDYVFHPIKGRYRLRPADKIGASAVAQWFRRFYAAYGFEGCSSHSGRRSYITQSLRDAPLNGCSIRDVQLMAGHRSMQTTAGYAEPSESQVQMIDNLYSTPAARPRLKVAA
jgi:integrase